MVVAETEVRRGLVAGWRMTEPEEGRLLMPKFWGGRPAAAAAGGGGE